jgi:iron complex transport system substrate-binding protein
MKVIKRLTAVLLILVLMVSAVGCAETQAEDAEEPEVLEEETEQDPNEESEEEPPAEVEKAVNKYPEFIIDNTEENVTYIDTRGEEITVSKNPEKTVVLINSLLDLWYLSGGEAIARCSGTTNVPEAAENIEIIGKFYSVSLEKLIALEPDLVVVSSTVSSQMEMEDVLAENGIEFAPVDASTNPYTNFDKNVYLFSQILDTEDIYERDIKEITGAVDEIIEKTEESEKNPSAVVLFSSSKYVKCELPTSLTGEMLDYLGVENIVADAQIEGSTKVDFSLERLIERDPDYIFVTTMGDVEECKARVEQDVQSNDAWNSLTAVKEGRVYYLPKDSYLYKPNARYPEAFKGLAEIVYPEVFTN